MDLLHWDEDRGQVLSVSEVNELVRQNVESEPLFQALRVRGEISNFKHHTSGHMYFTLKDDKSCLSAVMFRGDNLRLRFRPENGMAVVASGRLGVYEPRGTYQLYVQKMQTVGAGDLHVAFEQLKKKLQAEGLFDRERKRPLPRFPSCIGVVTSISGAAIRDIIQVVSRRMPGVEIVIAPARVQGDGAAESVAAGIRLLDRYPGIDVIILGRGGGSLEELWAFNEEVVARAIAASSVPTISAVGHEVDFTIADFVADARAPTPSAAAEMAVPERAKLEADIQDRAIRMYNRISRLLEERRTSLQVLCGRRGMARMFQRLEVLKQQLDEAHTRAANEMEHLLDKKRSSAASLAERLSAVSPLNTLARGYAICEGEDGQVISSCRQVCAGESITVVLQDGLVDCGVQKTRLCDPFRRAREDVRRAREDGGEPGMRR